MVCLMLIRLSSPDAAPALLEVWRSAVLATHGFLSTEDFSQIEREVANDYLPHATLWMACEVDGSPQGFLGMTGRDVDTLFIH